MRRIGLLVLLVLVTCALAGCGGHTRTYTAQSVQAAFLRAGLHTKLYDLNAVAQAERARTHPPKLYPVLKGVPNYIYSLIGVGQKPVVPFVLAGRSVAVVINRENMKPTDLITVCGNVIQAREGNVAATLLDGALLSKVIAAISDLRAQAHKSPQLRLIPCTGKPRK